MKIKSDLPLSRETIQKILDSPIPYEDKEREDEQEMMNLLAELTPAEVEIAAQTSYAYWLATLSEKPPTVAEREKMALRELRRTLFKNPYKKALTMVKETVQQRVEMRIDIIRSCFLDKIEYDSVEETALAIKVKEMVESDMTKQICVVRGHDKGNLAILTVFARKALGESDEAFLMLMLYAMERATAATEFLSMAECEKIMVILDFGSFDSAVAPSWKASKSVAKVLQNHYPERLKRLVILDPPFWIKAMYKMVSPFLDPLTKKKFVVCSGPEQKRVVMEEFVEPEQAMPFMRPDGKLTGEVDVQHYLRGVPFHMTYHSKSESNGTNK
ncbi:hypothetical protein ACA910_012642 [Epithemia clementina (nom. ined.)]